MANLKQYHYLIFTSVNGVTAFFERLFDLGLDCRALGGVTTASIGPRTKSELEKYSVKCDLLPLKFVAEEFLEVFPNNLENKRILIPRALEAREVLPEGLRSRGAQVDVIPAYRTVAADDLTEIKEDVQIALFTSSSSAEHFMKRVELKKDCKIGSIGPITSDTLRSLGKAVDFEAEEHTVLGLVESVVRFIGDNAIKEI